MECLAGTGCELILNEVYECDDVNAVISRGDALFSLLPSPAAKPPLSDRSPYRADSPD
jgi:hypothetical protein